VARYKKNLMHLFSFKKKVKGINTLIKRYKKFKKLRKLRKFKKLKKLLYYKKKKGFIQKYNKKIKSYEKR